MSARYFAAGRSNVGSTPWTTAAPGREPEKVVAQPVRLGELGWRCATLRRHAADRFGMRPRVKLGEGASRVHLQAALNLWEQGNFVATSTSLQMVVSRSRRMRLLVDASFAQVL